MDTNAELTSREVTVTIPVLPHITLDWFIFFLIWPFAALVSALKKFREPFSKTIFWLFCIYFGLVFIYADPYGKGNADSARYAKSLIELHSEPVSLNKLLQSFYDPVSGLTDIYQPLVTWVVSVFSGDPRILFMVFAMVFGFFWTQNLWIIITRIRRKVGFLLFLLIISYLLINPIWHINGVRMYTAAQVFLYGSLIYLIDGKRKGLLWATSSILFHFSFMFPVALLLVYLFLPRNLWILFLFFIAASFIKEINIKAVREMLSFLPDVFQPKIESYTSDPYIKRVFESRQEMAWHVKFSDLAGRIVIYVWALITFFNRKKFIDTKPDILKLFSLALFIGGFAQIASLIPSGGRFITISNSLFYATFVLFIADIQTKKLVNLIKVLTIPLIIFTIIFNIRIAFDYTGVMVFFGNPLFCGLFYEQTRLIELVKLLF